MLNLAARWRLAAAVKRLRRRPWWIYTVYGVPGVSLRFLRSLQPLLDRAKAAEPRMGDTITLRLPVLK